ncbi:MAG: uncharacterized protein KVP18_003455 [Porospora cf. gigantea A]|uniref:uncharacterized protein n=2 Tax=Porospora cf. gigantea A TaxID=2853593 RepID=UPI003559E703|nr:MAG: hypothetical protein KVP18_003455 [Porospora cf. gigantea A]
MAAGSVFTKKGIEQHAMLTGRLRMYPVSSPTWAVSQAAYLFGVLVHFAALAFAPASVLAPTNSVGLVVNALMSAIVLHEPVTVSAVAGICGILVGLTMCGAAGFLPHGGQNPDVSGIDSWSDPWFLVFLGVVLASVTLGLAMVTTYESMWEKYFWGSQFSTHVRAGHTEAPLPGYSPASRSDVVCCGVHISPPDFTRGAEGFPLWVGIIYGVMAGVVGSFVVLELKEFLAVVTGSAPWGRFQLYLSLGILVASTLGSNHMLSLGLSRGKAMIVIPTYYVSWTLCGTLGGVTKFHEGQNLTRLQLSLMCGGVLCTLLSVLPLAVSDLSRLSKTMARILRIADSKGEAAPTRTLGLPLSLAMVTLEGMAGKGREPRYTPLMTKAYSLEFPRLQTRQKQAVLSAHG